MSLENEQHIDYTRTSKQPIYQRILRKFEEHLLANYFDADTDSKAKNSQWKDVL
jgi:hypothetical protein